ncbi:MAG TPA: tol-pal system protein YbgF [Gammaproteobacteria bacterium]|nr:tol-pal system protein YbgF [Gammaproteobacteria bacterium]
MKWRSVWVLTGAITLSAPHCVAALAIVESRTGEPIVYDTTKPVSAPLSIARSSEDRAMGSRGVMNAPLEDRAALLSLKHLETLKQEVSELRGLVETQDHEIQQLKKSQQDFYTDLDKRMTQLQSTKGIAVSKTASKTLVVVSPPPPAKKSSVTIVPTGTTSLPATEETIEEPITSDFSESTLETDHATEKSTYEAAYNLVRTKRYSEATSAFQNYLARFKTGEHAANAHYWVGEIYMVEWQKDPQNKTLLDKAAHAFSNIASQFPGNPKVPDALLKLGIIENEKGNPIAAQKHFTNVKNRYPGSAAARIAETRLKQLLP